MRSDLNDRVANNAPDEALDPVCGMKVTANGAAGSAEYQDRKYYFCCTHCFDKFRADPESYATSRLTATPIPRTAGEAFTPARCIRTSNNKVPVHVLNAGWL